MNLYGVNYNGIERFVAIPNCPAASRAREIAFRYIYKRHEKDYQETVYTVRRIEVDAIDENLVKFLADMR